MANISEDEKQSMFSTLEQIYCSPNLTAGIHGQLTFISALNAFLSITAFLGNALILVTLRQESSLHPPTKLLLSNLATTDLCVGVIVQPLAATLLLTVVNEHWNICRHVLMAAVITSSVSCAVSLWTLNAISLDRLLALLLGLRYRQVVTLKRVYLVIITFWIMSTVPASAITFFWNSPIWLWFGIIVVSLGLMISTFSYTKIFITLRHHQHQIQGHIQQPNQTNQLNIGRYRKAMSTALWLQFTLAVCYLPYVMLVSWITRTELSSTVSIALSYSLTLVYLNSSLNPILYCWKLDGVRQAVRDIIRPALCC